MTQRPSTSSRGFLAAFIALAPFLMMSSSKAFSIKSTVSKSGPRIVFSPRAFASTKNTFRASFPDNARIPSPTSLSMYNLPPSGGGGGGKSEIAEIAKGAVTLLLVIGFFVSPLGGLVLGIFNSFLVLAFLLPLVATVGFQIWTSLNTVKGECPNCGAPATVMKNKSNGNLVDGDLPAQSLCFNCGAVLQANDDNTSINNVTGRRSIDDMNSPMGGGASLFDLFSGGFNEPTSWVEETTTTTTTTASGDKKSPKSGIDKSSIIDVDVLDEDKPFQ